MRFNDIITVYNIIPQQGRDPPMIRRTVVHGVFWDSTCGVAFSKTGKESGDNITVMIPDMASCIPAAQWFAQSCPEEDKFTLSPGDIIARGVCGDITSAADLERQHTEKLIITAVRDCRFGSKSLWHWEVSGK